MEPDLSLDDAGRPDADRVFDGLDEAEAGETVVIDADGDLAGVLLRYGIDRGWRLSPGETDDGALRVEKREPLDDGERPAFDARRLPPQRRHEVLTGTFADLDPGEGFVLVNDHDPKPLYHELRSTHGDVVEWDYRHRGGGEWRVEVAKSEASETAAEDGVRTKFDVREIPKQERHPTIHHRYGMLPEGATMELVAPHVPRPLKREFQQRYGDAFEWVVVESEPGRCRVHVTKTEDVDAADADAEAAADAGCGHDHGHDAAGAEEPDDAPAGTDDEQLEVVAELDVRDLPPAQRHERIFRRYAELGPGEAFELVNDHDPKPLYHQFDAEASDAFRWAYRQKEPGEFRVQIGKHPAAEPGTDADFGGHGGDGHETDPDAPF